MLWGGILDFFMNIHEFLTNLMVSTDLRFEAVSCPTICVFTRKLVHVIAVVALGNIHSYGTGPPSGPEI